MKIGDIDVQPISDGTVWEDGGGAFGLVPKAKWEKLIPCDDMNRIPMALRCLLVRTADATILVETGMGDKITPEMAAFNNVRLERPDGGLLDNLKQKGLAPDDIDIVIMTHLHADHSGGCTSVAGGRFVPAFPRARYWVQRREWENAHRLNERTRGTYLSFNYDPIEEAGQLQLVDGDCPVAQGIRVALAPGHTSGTQIVVIESGGDTAVFLGDIAFLHWQIERLAWVSAYDLEPNVTIETKRIWQKWLADRNAVIFFQHDPLVIAGTLTMENRQYRVQPLLEA